MENGSSRSAADIIIPAHNQFNHTRALLEGIYRHSDLPFHIYVIDNASSDETVDLAKIYTRDITVVRNRENSGWCAAINQGIRLGSNPCLVFMKNDVEVDQGWLGNLIAFLETHPRIGAVGPLGSNPRDWQCADRVREKMVPQIPRFLTDDLHERNRVLRYHFHRAGVLIEGMLAFFCTALKRRAVEAVGDLDEEFVHGGDSEDYCRRLRKAGYVLGLSLDTYVAQNFPARRRPLPDAGGRHEFRKASAARFKEKHTHYS
jgi:GT2 family glycosyltransferase